MAFQITQAELAYQGTQSLEGKTYKVFLATVGSLTVSSTIAEWEAAEIASSNGYTAATGTVGAGSYNSTTNRYEQPVITGTFTATGSGFTYGAIVVKLSGRTHPYAVNILASPVTLASGQSRGFNLTIGTKAA